MTRHFATCHFKPTVHGTLCDGRLRFVRFGDGSTGWVCRAHYVRGDTVLDHPARPAEPTPTNGVDRCECGCKYWDERGRCIDCGDVWDAPESEAELNARLDDQARAGSDRWS